MTTYKITMMDAYAIESLREKGITNEVLLAAAASGDTTRLLEADPEGSFDALLKLGEDRDALESILNDGYQIKFVTYNGLRNLLRMKFRKPFTELDNGIEGLHLSVEELIQLKKLLSSNWVLKAEEVNDGYVASVTYIE
ncbi:hypothetical protein [Rossellomorea marisflavi]|uniref:hypothetical protein n=1 Tax=Rossellomorea marisflavi TaxID=189381 RepID=UPI003F9F22EF